MSANPALNGTLTHPNNIDESLNKAAKDKIRKYRADYNNNPPNAVAFTRLRHTRTSILVPLVVSIPHGSVTNTGDEYQCVLLISLHKCVEYDQEFVPEAPPPS